MAAGAGRALKRRARAPRAGGADEAEVAYERQFPEQIAGDFQ
ncbi:hypothetical protein PT2222_160063 [Paraburkholderia tropica]